MKTPEQKDIFKKTYSSNNIVKVSYRSTNCLKMSFCTTHTKEKRRFDTLYQAFFVLFFRV